jgi:hypothetical protein
VVAALSVRAAMDRGYRARRLVAEVVQNYTGELAIAG